MKRFVSGFFIVAVFLFLVIGLHYLLFSLAGKQGMFDVKEINVSGNNLTRKRDIIRYSGLEWGVPLLQEDLLQSAALISQHPFVDYAVVARFPPSTIEILVVEQVPVAILNTDDEIYVCSADGGIMEDTGIESGLTVITTDYEVAIEDGAVEDQFLLATLRNLGDFARIGDVLNIIIKEDEGTYLVVDFVPDTLFYIGKRIANDGYLARTLSIADQMTNQSLTLSYVDVSDASGVGFQ